MVAAGWMDTVLIDCPFPHAISFSVSYVLPLIPSDVFPALTALSAYSIWTNFPLGLKVVNEKSAPLMRQERGRRGSGGGKDVRMKRRMMN